MTQRDAFFWGLLGAIVLGIFAHSFLPRYEWRAVNASGTALMVYDRWSGRFQRAEYDANGKVKAMDVYTPFSRPRFGIRGSGFRFYNLCLHNNG